MTGLLDAPVKASGPLAESADAAPLRGAGWRRLRTDARLARRQVWRTKGSSALVLLLVLLPVTGLAGGAIFWQSHVPTPEQAATLELGRHQSWIQVLAGPDPTRWQAVDAPWDTGVETDDAGRAVSPEQPRPDDPSALIPAGSVVHELVEWGGVFIGTATGVGNAAVTAGDVWDDAFEGRYVMVDGAVPADGDQAMVSPAMLDRLGAEIGDEFELVDEDRAFVISGTMRRADAGPADEEIFLPASAAGLVDGQRRWFVEDWQPGLAELEELNHAGFIAYARDLAIDPPPGARVSTWADDTAQVTSMITTGFMLALFSGYLVVLLAGAAFAVSARRQQQSLAVAASVGAARSNVFRVVVMQGTVLGAVAGVIGIALGAGLAWIALEATDTGAVNSFWGNWGYHVPWALVAAVAGFAVVVGTLSAIAPARAATRGDVLGALRGSRRPAVLRRKRPWWGLGFMIAGLVATALGATLILVLDSAEDLDTTVPLRVIALSGVALGPIVFQIGFLFAGHWVLVLVGRPLARIGLAPRLASRDSAANPSRVVPAFAAIAACVFIASYAISTTALTAAQNERTYWYTGPLHSVTAGVFESGEPTGDVLAAAEELLQPTSPTGTAVVGAPTSTAYDPRSGEPIDPKHPVWAVAGQRWEQCPECGTDPSSAMNGALAIVHPRDVSLLLDHPVDESVLAAYRDGAAITTTNEYLSPEGDVSITRWTEQSRNDFYNAMTAIDWNAPEGERYAHVPPPDEEIPIAAVSVDIGSSSSFQVMIAPETAEALGIDVAPSSLVATYDEPLEQAALDRLNAESQSFRFPDGAALWFTIERGPEPIAPWLWLIVAVAAVLVVGASAVVLGLARFERRPDDATLTAVGGSRGLRRRINAWQAAIIVGIGAVVGTLAGLIPVWGTAQSTSGYLRLVDMPWLWLGILAVGLPVAITLAAWLVPPRHPELTRRTVIT